MLRLRAPRKYDLPVAKRSFVSSSEGTAALLTPLSVALTNLNKVLNKVQAKGQAKGRRFVRATKLKYDLRYFDLLAQ